MKNTLGDLNNHLFAEIERLGDEGLKGDDLIEEISRATAITGVAEQIVSNATLVLKAQMAFDNAMSADTQKPKLLEG